MAFIRLVSFTSLSRDVFFRLTTPLLLFLVVSFALFAQAAVDDSPAPIVAKTSLVPGSLNVESLEIPNRNQANQAAVDIETKYFKVKLAAKGARIVSWRHKDLKNALRDNIELADPYTIDFEYYFRPLPRNYQQKIKNIRLAVETLSTKNLKSKDDDVNKALKEIFTAFQKIELKPSEPVSSLNLIVTKLDEIAEKNPNATAKIGQIKVMANKFKNESTLGLRKIRTALRSSSYKLSTKKDETSTTITARLVVNALHSGNSYKIALVKEFQFFNKIHYWQYSFKIENLSNKALTFWDGYMLPDKFIGPQFNANYSRGISSFLSFYHQADDFESKPTIKEASGGGGILPTSCGSKSQETSRVVGNINFFGNSSRFMVMTMQPMQKIKALTLADVGRRNNQDLKFKYRKEIHVELNYMSIAAGQTAVLPFLVYTGPKVKEFVKIDNDTKLQFPILEKVHEDLTKAFDFGYTAPIRDAIVFILDMFYKVIPNYGIGIILFAILFKLIFWPLNQKQADSMKKMQKLQPLMKVINEKYKSNPKEKQKRTMALYKEHKVNPVSGCLPMVIQLPIFIALYTAFSDSYDLWRSPFISGWINDLAQPDTVYTFASSMPIIGGFNVNILPIFMTATQFLQSKFTVVSGDDSQKKIMQFMPLMMLYFFWSMPAGVVLYWTIQNLLSIGQQVYTNMKTGTNNKKGD